jgi:hypothetical protein
LSYWRGNKQTNVHQVSRTITELNREDSTSSAAFEDEPNDKELGVQLNNVSKVNN